MDVPDYAPNVGTGKKKDAGYKQVPVEDTILSGQDEEQSHPNGYFMASSEWSVMVKMYIYVRLNIETVAL